jgi:hypothetical protein
MAERESTIKSFAKGLNLSAPEHLQPDGTYRYALNASFETHNGEIGYLINDLSNESCIPLNDNETIVGSCYIGNNESFVCVQVNNTISFDSIIYIFNHELCTKTVAAQPPSNYLNFSTLHPVQAEFRVRNGCERWVYFVDHYNTDKAINLDAPTNYYNNNPKLLEHTLYGNPYTISIVDVKNSGGKIPVGTLQITARYLDRYNNPTEFFGLTLPIPITLSENSFASIIGGKSGLADKSVEYKFENLDIAFSFLEIAVVETTEGISNAYIVDKVPIIGTSINYNYTGTDRATTKLSSLQEIVQQYSIYRIAKTITQRDSRLLKANLKAPEYNWLKFQRKAMDITTKYVVKEKRTQRLDYSANNPYYYFNDKSYMRDEVYAFGLRWVMKDGTKSPVFHIPGRASIPSTDTTTITRGNTATTSRNLVRDIVTADNWDKKLVNVSALSSAEYEHLTQYITGCTGGCPAYGGGVNTLYVLYTATNDTPTQFEVSLGAVNAALSFTFQETAPSNNSAGPTTFATTTHNVTINNAAPNEANSVFGVLTITYTSGTCTWTKRLELDIDGLERLITCNNADGYVQLYTTGTKRGIKVEISEFSFDTVVNSATCKIDRWRLYNTAIPDTTPDAGYYESGLMAYTQSDSEVYPTIEDCDGNSVFGATNQNTPVRHHKFPDAQISPYFTGWHSESYEYPEEMHNIPISIYPIGIKFNNVQPPAEYASQVDYYEIVRCDVEETVLDKGLLSTFRLENFGKGDCRFSLNPNYEGLTTAYTTPNNTVKDTEVISPKALFNKELLKPDYIKLERVHGFLRKDIANQPGGTGPTSGIYYRNVIDGNLTNSLLVAASFKGSVSPWGNRTVNNELLLKYDSYFTDDRYPYGTAASSQNQIGYFVNLTSSVPFTVIAKGTPSFTGPYNSANYIQYVSLKKVNFNQYYGLSNLKYIRCQNNVTSAATTSTVAFGGDTFLSRMEYLQTFNLNGELLNHVINTSYVCNVLTEKYYYSTRVSFITESRVNTELRTFENNQYFYPYVINYSNNFLDPFDTSLGYHLEQSGLFNKWQELFYTYNNDYSFSGGVNTFFSPDYTEPCSDCKEYYPNRVVWTNTSEPEDTFDNYRVFRLADFLDVQGHKGDITRIFPEGDYLTIDCERTRFIVATTRQSLQGTTETIYVGLGDYLANQMREVSNASIGFLGNQSQFCFENTEYGVFTVDQKAGKVFKTFNNQPEILSNKGLRSWFASNLPSEIETQYLELTGDKYPLMDKVIRPNGGVGVISVYDSRFERLFITKRDFKLTAEGIAKLNAVAPNEHIRINENGIYRYDELGTEFAIRQENYPEWFENHSWTISYSVKHDAFMSWHSFLPSHYIIGMNMFLSGINDDTVNGNGINPHKHNKQYNYQTYYGKLYPHIIEVVAATPVEPTILKNVRVLATSQEYDNTHGQFVTKPETFFNKLCVYNSRQSTGELSLHFINSDLSENIKNVTDKIPVVYRDNYYNFNQFADLSDNKSALFSTAWSDIKDDYFTDKVINESGLIKNKPWYNRMAFRDRYHIIRLTHDKASNVKLSTNFVINYNENIYG